MRAELRKKLGDEEGASQDIAKADEIKPHNAEEKKELFTEMQNRVKNEMQNANPLGL